MKKNIYTYVTYMCVCITESLCSTAEINIVNQLCDKARFLKVFFSLFHLVSAMRVSPYKFSPQASLFFFFQAPLFNLQESLRMRLSFISSSDSWGWGDVPYGENSELAGIVSFQNHNILFHKGSKWSGINAENYTQSSFGTKEGKVCSMATSWCSFAITVLPMKII